MSIRLIIMMTMAACIICGAADASTKKSRADVASATRTVECQGPKKRLAVLRFGGTGKYGAYEGWDVGDGLAAQLATALEQTHCFIIADRMALSDVLREQELGLAGAVNRETAARAGALIGAQILVKGEITEFEPGQKSRGLTAGIGLGNIPLGLRVGGNRNTAHIAADIRLIDASTGEVLFTQRVDSQAKTFGLSLGVDYKSATVGSDNFDKTPLGMAARDAVVEATGYIVKQTREIQWTGQVVQAEAGAIFVNAGAESGVKVGDSFVVSTVDRELIDPSTGVSLGRVERTVGEVRVEQVNSKYAIAKPLSEFPVRRGDLIRAAGNRT
ncbi:MAG TPA: CsgG/HfaB family protein [Steroidobacteraceae bacterium]|nr:CsgG/HfaB family protein [Steroidobacteraceae bacterium]